MSGSFVEMAVRASGRRMVFYKGGNYSQIVTIRARECRASSCQRLCRFARRCSEMRFKDWMDDRL